MKNLLLALLPRPNLIALPIATLFFVASLTPSLVPRDTIVQAVLSGFSLAAGYAVGVILATVWERLELPRLRPVLLFRIGVGLMVICLLVASVTLWFASDWQNELRLLLTMPPVETARPFSIAGGAVAVFLLLLWLARLAGWLVARLSLKIARVLPGPQAFLVAVTLTALLFWNIGNGVIIRGALNTADRIYAALDARIDDDIPRPEGPMHTGSDLSLISWESLGRQGRATVAAGPDRTQIADLTGAAALQPLRVYVGLNSAPDPKARAELALQELLRMDGFSRSTLVIATPTGTGWVDPAGQQALEYLLAGDVATVSVQYSYLASWIALMTDPDYGVETARAVFSEIYNYWRELPADARPKLYLNGLSLGSLNSDKSHDLHQVVGDPFHGALWVGPPFGSPTWREVTRNRNPGTPAWLPSYRDGSAVRFMTQTDLSSEITAPWGRFRILYLQYASDAVVFFEPSAAWRRPDWMVAPRGPDVSPRFQWLPIVTLLQLGVDIMTAVAPPVGFGHSYDFPSYARAWAMLLELDDWTDDRIDQLHAAHSAAE